MLYKQILGWGLCALGIEMLMCIAAGLIAAENHTTFWHEMGVGHLALLCVLAPLACLIGGVILIMKSIDA